MSKSLASKNYYRLSKNVLFITQSYLFHFTLRYEIITQSTQSITEGYIYSLKIITFIMLIFNKNWKNICIQFIGFFCTLNFFISCFKYKYCKNLNTIFLAFSNKGRFVASFYQCICKQITKNTYYYLKIELFH